MAKLPRFLVTPVWKKLSRGYGSLTSPQIKRFFARPSVKRTLRCILITVTAYLLLIAVGALSIYRFRATNDFTHFTESIFPYPAAIVRGESIPLTRFRLEVAARKHFAEVQKIAYTEDEIDAFVTDQLVTRALFAQVLKENKLTISEEELTTRMESIITEAGSSEKLSQFLREQYGDAVTIDVYRMWMHDAAVQSAIQQKLLSHAEIKHILVAVPQGSGADAIEKARLKAVDIRSSITDVAMFDDVAKARSEDASSRDKGGYFGITNRGDASPILSEAFEAAAFNLPVGQVSDPILTPAGWHIITIISREGTIDLSKKALLEQERKRGTIRTFMTE
ncbi:hypothetical protein BH11PAT4_BH11PAT4_0360 [soil metagenome]